MHWQRWVMTTIWMPPRSSSADGPMSAATLRQHAAPADILAVGQLDDLGLAIEGQGEFLRLPGVERGGEDRAFAQLDGPWRPARHR